MSRETARLDRLKGRPDAFRPLPPDVLAELEERYDVRFTCRFFAATTPAQLLDTLRTLATATAARAGAKPFYAEMAAEVDPPRNGDGSSPKVNVSPRGGT